MIKLKAFSMCWRQNMCRVIGFHHARAFIFAITLWGFFPWCFGVISFINMFVSSGVISNHKSQSNALMIGSAKSLYKVDSFFQPNWGPCYFSIDLWVFLFLFSWLKNELGSTKQNFQWKINNTVSTVDTKIVRLMRYCSDLT